MPGDSSILIHSGDSIRLPLFQQPVVLPGKTGAGEEQLFFLMVAFVTGIIALAFFTRWLKVKYKQKKVYRAARANFLLYDEWLTAYNGYYRSLPAGLRQRFLDRVAWFIASKTFTCVNIEQETRMPLLISAASVQISFGLDKYLLSFFDNIYIMQRNYNYGAYDRPFEGHVSSNGIYLSWENFLKGYENYTDADNVGLHEMAHALAYVNFMAGTNDAQDNAFIQRFYDFSAVARPVFNAMQNGGTNLLNAYAATNYNEFWAVAVETFFEKSLQMRLEMPALYTSLCKLLNQDPLTPEKILA